MKKLRQIKIFGLIVGGMIIIGLWIFLAPTKLGGSTTYSVTSGISMQPLLYKNDLALVRAQSSYKVGEVVLYQSPVLGKPVLHRIILIQNGNYFFKGDNNNFVDPGYATRSELTGKLWVHIPKAGAALGWFGKPLHAAFLGGSAIMLFVLTGLSTTRRRHGRRHGVSPTHKDKSRSFRTLVHTLMTTAPPPTGSARVPSYLEGPTPTLIALAILLALGLLLLGVGFSRPLHREIPLANAYQQKGSFGYSATVKAPTVVYPSGTVTTGEPIYPSVIDSVTLHFKYQFTSSLPHKIKGTIAFKALLLSHTDTWQDLTTIAPTTAFNGDSTSVASNLSLSNLDTLIDNVSQQTGIRGNYSADIQPIVHINGTVGGKLIDQTFAPVLPFTIGQSAITLTDTITPAPPGATYVTPSAGSARSATLNPAQSGSVPHLAANQITVAKYRVNVTAIRLLGLFFCTLALLVALVHDTLRRHMTIQSHDELIEDQFESLVVPVTSLGVVTGARLIAVPDFAELARLAHYLERPILCETNEGNRTYVVDDETDRYVTYLPVNTARPVSAAAVNNIHKRPKQTLAAPTLHHRKRGSALLRGGVVLLMLVIAAGLVTSFTASTTVPASHAGKSLVLTRTILQLAPVGCNALTLNSIVNATGTSSNSLSHVLILGNSAINTITDTGTGNCIVAGGGKDKVTAPSTDICIIGPTTGSTYGSCTTKTQ
jgi:signal peptidase I